MKKVLLLTGARGFIGTHCLETLAERGFKVHAISSRGRWNSVASEVEWHHADLHNAEHIVKLMLEVKPQYLLHLAWDVSHGVYWSSLENLRWVRSSLNLLQAFADAGGERVVIAGSCAEYDWRYGFCNENLTPLKPATLYGVCKDALQKMTIAACLESGVSAAWGRLFFLFGPGENENRLVPAVITALLKGEDALSTHGEQIRDYLYVKDVASALAALLDSDIEGPVNIASGEPIKLMELIGLAAKECGRSDLVRLGALKPAADDPPLLLADTRRLFDEVGWQTQYSLQEGIRETVAWWKQKI
jgi:nucleoside-diphosphate-sugar epimerase